MSKIFAILLVLVVAAFIYFNYFAYLGTIPGKKAPEIEATLIDGSTFKLSDMQGKYVLVDFWGSWCPPCRAANPMLVKLYEKYKDQNFDILSIAIEKKEGRAEKAIIKDNLSWSSHIISINKIVLASEYARLYGVSDLPTHILINPQGEVMGRNLSFDKLNHILSTRIK